MASLARQAALAALRCARSQGSGQSLMERLGSHQTRSMGGGGAGVPWHRSYDGKPPPPEFQTPEFLTYAGLTLPKPKEDLHDFWGTKALGAVFW